MGVKMFQSLDTFASTALVFHEALLCPPLVMLPLPLCISFLCMCHVVIGCSSHMSGSSLVIVLSCGSQFGLLIGWIVSCDPDCLL